ncbi:MAG: hypothetical protein IPN53_11760 [Comamonadaceae bacterium]|nr:hypothetical protein [Comamonadaceae bacterium]
MSVINKMLRDLDSRQQAQATVKTAKTFRSSVDDLTVGTLAVGNERSLAPGRPTGAPYLRAAWFAVGSMFLAVVAYTTWWWQHQLPDSPAVDAAAVAKVAVPQSQPQAPSSAPGVAANADPEVFLPSAASQPVVGKSVSGSSAAIQKPLAAKMPAPVAPLPGDPADNLATGKLTLKLSSSAPSSQATASAPAAAVSSGLAESAVAPATPGVLTTLKTARPTTQELVVQAQALWGEGSRGAAAALLKGAVAQLESTAIDAGPDMAATAMLVREYARVTVANGQASEALATLERLEPRLSGMADIWAIRGNAAQRLGQHPQAVAAYQRALALRSGEPRWMLGAAVSMAAMGQTGPAAELAEKARIAKALPADVANYLRQLGVRVRSD